MLSWKGLCTLKSSPWTEKHTDILFSADTPGTFTDISLTVAVWSKLGKKLKKVFQLLTPRVSVHRWRITDVVIISKSLHHYTVSSSGSLSYSCTHYCEISTVTILSSFNIKMCFILFFHWFQFLKRGFHLSFDPFHEHPLWTWRSSPPIQNQGPLFYLKAFSPFTWMEVKYWVWRAGNSNSKHINVSYSHFRVKGC